MIPYIVYLETGEIKKTGICQESDLLLQAEAGQLVTSGSAMDSEHYMDLTDPDNPVPVAKTPIPYSLSGTTISDLPECTATLLGNSQIVTDGILYVFVDILIADIKAEANQRIIGALPEWKQRNLIARGVELLDLQIGGQVLTPTEEAERVSIKSAWDQVKNIRNYSDFLESEVDAGRYVDISDGWPTL